MRFTLSWRPLAAVLATSAVALLAACSDGSVTAPVVSTPTALATTIDIAGTAAVGAPLKNATVTLLCASGGQGASTTTGADGSYKTTVDSKCAAPYFLKVTGVDTSVTPTASITLYAFADAAGNINITPLTHIAASVATGGNPETEYQAVLKQSKTVDKSWNDTSKADAKAKLLDTLKKLGLDTQAGAISDVLQGKFKADGVDPLDKLLDALKNKRGGVPLDSLVEQIVQTGGATAGAPWKVWFPAGSDKVQLVGSGCSFTSATPQPNGSLPGNATFTFAKSAGTLTMSVETGTVGYSLTPVVVNASTTGSFNLSLRGDSDQVQSTSMYTDGNTNYFSYSGPILLGSTLEQPQRPLAALTLGSASARVECTSIVKPLLRSGLNLDLSSRVASIMAGTTAAVITPASSSSCSVGASNAVTTYTYAITSVGGISIDGVNLSANYLQAANTAYSENSGVGVNTSPPYLQVTTNTLVSKSVSLFGKYSTSPLTTSCSNAQIG